MYIRPYPIRFHAYVQVLETDPTILRAVAEAICQEAVAKRQYGQAKIVQVPMKIRVFCERNTSTLPFIYRC